MGEKTKKELMEEYKAKCKIMGIKPLEFFYDEELDKVYVKKIYPDEIKEVIIPHFVFKVYYKAWYNDYGLRSLILHIPKGCTVETYPYDTKCDLLVNHVEKFVVNKNHEIYSSENGVLFNKDKTILIAYPSEKKDTEYTVPRSVIKIEEDAFSGNDYLKKLYVGENVVYMEGIDLSESIEVTISEENTSYKSIRGSIYSKDGKVLFHIYGKHQDKIEIEDGTTLIKNISLEGKYEEISIPKTVKIIEEIGNIMFAKIENFKVPKEFEYSVENELFTSQVFEVEYY